MANPASTLTRTDTNVVFGASSGPRPTPAESGMRLECLPGCDDSHTVGRGNECHVVHTIGTAPWSWGDGEMTVRGYSSTDGALRYAEVGILLDEDDHPDCERFLDPDAARKLARLLLEAADIAERVAAGNAR